MRLSTAVEAAGVSMAFSGVDGPRLSALDRVDLKVEPSEFCCLIGPSGCGKSTLLNIIAGLLRPTTGEVRIAGSPVRGIDRRLGYMFQKDTLLPWATAVENVRLPLEATGRRDDGESRLLLELVGLRGFERHFPYQLSGGMRKRVQLARLLAQQPEIFLMDEPFGALDAQTKLLIHEVFLRIWERDRRTVLFVTHDLSEAITLSDRIVLMTARPGRIKEVFAVNIPRPRDVSAVMSDPRFNHLFTTIWSSLRQEAVLV